MKTKYAYLIAILFMFGACRPAVRGPMGGTEVEYEKTPEQLNRGGADTGGGAGAKGRLLENYQVRIVDTPEFKNRVLLCSRN